MLGCSQPAASRRLDRLISSGALFFDVEIAPEHVAHGLGPIEGVQAVQTAPVIRTVKRAGTLIEPP